MPMVGKKKFSYSPAGKKAAMAESKKTGKPMMSKKTMGKKKMGKKK